MKNIETIYPYIALGLNWWEDTYCNLLLLITKHKENQLLTIEEIYNFLCSMLRLTDINRENLLYVLDRQTDYFERKTDTTYFIKAIPDSRKEKIQNDSSSSILELNKEKESIEEKIKKISSKSSYTKGFLLLILYPILTKITLQLFKSEFTKLETRNNKFNLTPYFKKFYAHYPEAKTELAVENLLHVDLYSEKYIKKIIRAILFIELINDRNSKEINEEYFDSEEFNLFIETHFLLSIEVIKSTILIEDHFSKSAESISKILVNDSFKRGQLYDDYLKSKWTTIQEKYEEKITDLLVKKEEELLDLVNESKDILNDTKIENKNFSQKLEELFQEKNNQLNEIAHTLNKTLEKMKSEHELQRKALDSYIDNNNVQMKSIFKSLQEFEKNTSKTIFNQTEEFKKRDLTKRENELKAFDLETQRKKEQLIKRRNKKEKEKEKFPSIDVTLQKQAVILPGILCIALITSMFLILWAYLHFNSIFFEFSNYSFYIFLTIESILGISSLIALYRVCKIDKDFIKSKADTQRDQNEQERIDRELNSLDDELGAYLEEADIRRNELVNAINDIRQSIGAKPDITHNAVSIGNLFKDSEVNMNQNQEQFNFNGPVQGQNQQFGGKGTINSNHSSSTFTQNNSGEIEMVLQELKSNLDKLNLSSQDKSRVQEEIQTIEAIAQTSNPKKEIMKQSFQTIRNILEGITASVIASNLILGIKALTLFKQ